MQDEQTEAAPEVTPETEPTEAPAVEPETPPEGEAPPEEAEAKGEEEAPEGEPGEEPEPAKTEAKSKPRGGWYRKIDRLEQSNAEKDALIQRLISQQSSAPSPTPATPKDPTAQAQEYIGTLVKQQLEAERAQEKQARAQEDFNRRMQETQARHPDFDDAMHSVRHIPVPTTLNQVILTSEQGTEIMYQLAKSPAELARIARLPPLELAREIGRLEAKTASSTAAPKTPTKSATRPPVPPTTVGGSAKSTGNLDDLPLADYKRAFRSKGR